MSSNGIFTGTAGVYHVMSELSLARFHAAATLGNAPDFDILVCSAEGDISAAIQVKSTLWAVRKSNFDFPLSYRAAKMNRKRFFVAFVDFAEHEKQKPSIYLVPSEALHEKCAEWIDKYEGKMIRFKPEVEWMKAFKIEDNKWNLLKEAGISAAVDDPSTSSE